jgi:hypothetical protein
VFKHFHFLYTFQLSRLLLLRHLAETYRELAAYQKAASATARLDAS